MKSFFTLCLIYTYSLSLNAQTTDKKITLDATIEMAVNHSISAKIANGDREIKFYEYKSYQAELGPKLDILGNLLDYNKNYSGIIQPDGTLLFQKLSQNYSTLNLSLSQNISLTGGNITVNNTLSRFDSWSSSHQKEYSGVPINISLSQPLFAFNSFKLDREIALKKYEEAKKQFKKDSCDIALQVTMLYFDVLDAEEDLELSTKDLDNQNYFYEIETKRINLGTTSRDKILQIKLQILNSTNSLSAARVNLKTSISKLNNYVGLQDSSSYILVIPEQLIPINITKKLAIEEAKRNRPEFIEFDKSILEAEKDFKTAKRQRFNVNLFATYGLNNIGNNVSAIYTKPNNQQSLTIGVDLPIVDFGRNKAKIDIAKSTSERLKFQVEQQKSELILEITSLIDNFELVGLNIKTAREADQIAQERYDLVKEQFRFGKTSVTELNIALNEKDQAKRTYIATLRAYWQSYNQLKILTLMDSY